MKNFAALILAVSASSAFAGETNSLQVSGKAARELYDALSVDVTVPDSEQGNGGINPLQGRKFFESADKKLTIECEGRFYTKDCNITAESELLVDGLDNIISVGGETAVALYDALNIAATNPEFGSGNGGINPLRGRKDLQTSDGQLNVSCEVRLYSKDCTISKHSR